MQTTETIVGDLRIVATVRNVLHRADAQGDRVMQVSEVRVYRGDVLVKHEEHQHIGNWQSGKVSHVRTSHVYL